MRRFGMIVSAVVLIVGWTAPGRSAPDVLMIAPHAPPPPRTDRQPQRPSAGAIWIGGRWDRRDGLWVWRHGHWDMRHPGRTWHPGRWVRAAHGYDWIRGHW